MFAWEMGFRAIILKRDAKNVISSFKDSSADLSYNRVLLHEAFIFASWFQYFRVKFDLARSCDQVAHFLPAQAKTIRNVLNFDSSFE